MAHSPYQPEEVEVLRLYLDRAFPFRRKPEALCKRSQKSIQQRLTRMRREAGLLYRVKRERDW